MAADNISDIMTLYSGIKKDIAKRLDEFKVHWEMGSENEIFAELVFCLLTPQSKAKVCWPAVVAMVTDGSLYSGGKEEILEHVCHIRFKNNKTGYILLARELFTGSGIKGMNQQIDTSINIKKTILNLGTPMEIREWLVANVKGMGYKEASHFLRNIGMGEGLAILDRHILRNLAAFEVIEAILNSISKKRYMDIEESMRQFSRKLDIPMDHLDLLLWYREAGELYK